MHGNCLSRREGLTSCYAAVMLLRMDAPAQVWPMLKHRPDPRVHSDVIDRISSRSSDPDAIIAR